MATATSTGSGSWSGAIWSGGSGSGGAPADGDAVVIAAGHNVLMDSDLSAWTGLTTLTINGDNSTPGMLYFKDGTSGYLRFRTGTNYGILGSVADVTYHGRLLANSDGVWGNTGSLAFANKAIILFDGTSYLNCLHLDVALYCTEPTNKYVRTYGTKYRVTGSASADTLTKSSHGLANATPVMIMVAAGGSLPTPLEDDLIYYVVNTATDTFKLAYASGGTAIDLTTDGSGDIDVYTGAGSSVNPVNVLTDLTADTPWTTTDGHDYVVLSSLLPTAVDAQLLQLGNGADGIDADHIHLSAATDSVQSPGARIYLASRNVSIRHSTTSNSQTCVGNIQSGSVFNCELRFTQGAKQYGRGYATCGGPSAIGGATFGGTIVNSFFALREITQCTVSANMLYNSYPMYSIAYSSITGDFAGSEDITNNVCTGIVFSGNVYGGTSSPTLIDSEISGIIMGVQFGPNAGRHNIYTGTIKNVGTQLGGSEESSVVAGRYIVDPATTIFPSSSGYASAELLARNVRGMQSAPVVQTRLPGYAFRFSVEDANNNLNNIYTVCGNIVKTACTGVSDAPSVDPDGGSGYCLEASNIQAHTTTLCPFVIIRGARIWLTAGAHTISYKIQTTYTTSVDLILDVYYIGANGWTSKSTKSYAVPARSNASDWTQSITTESFTTTADGWCTVYLKLTEYESGDEVYVWPEPVIT